MSSFLKNLSTRSKWLTDIIQRKPVVAVIPLNGSIMAGSSFGRPILNMENARKMIDNAFNQRDLQIVILSINSPGGSAVQSDLIASYIKAKSEKANVKVIAFVEDTAASGGYWLACAAEEIYAARSSVVGSIGVISGGLGFHELINKYGIERRVFTAGERKAIMDPLSPLKEEDVAIIRKLLSNIHDHFIDHVKTSRGGRLRSSDATLFSGEFWTGKPAEEHGLIDGIDHLDAYIQRNYGDKVRVYRAKKSSSLTDLLGAMYQGDISFPLLGRGLEHQLLGPVSAPSVESFRKSLS